MALAGPDALSHAPLDRPRPLPVGEEGDVLLPGESNQDPQPMVVGQVEDPARWLDVRANRIDPVRRHGAEVGGDHVVIRKGVPAHLGRERPVRHPADVELVTAGEDKFSASHGPNLRRLSLPDIYLQRFRDPLLAVCWLGRKTSIDNRSLRASQTRCPSLTRRSHLISATPPSRPDGVGAVLATKKSNFCSGTPRSRRPRIFTFRPTSKGWPTTWRSFRHPAKRVSGLGG